MADLQIRLNKAVQPAHWTADFQTYLDAVWHLPVQQKQANSTSLFIPSLSFSARKRLKAKLRFTLVLDQALYACRFASQGLYFLFFTAISISSIFSGLNGVESSLPTLRLTCVLSLAGGNTPTPHPEMSQLNQNIKIQAEGRKWCLSRIHFVQVCVCF